MTRVRQHADTLREALDAIAGGWCNGCRQPPRRWGPNCGAMTTGDMTHYHSAAWWANRARAACDRLVAAAETTPDDGFSGGLLAAGCDCPWEERGHGLSTVRTTHHRRDCPLAASPVVEDASTTEQRQEATASQSPVAEALRDLSDYVGSDWYYAPVELEERVRRLVAPHPVGMFARAAKVDPEDTEMWCDRCKRRHGVVWSAPSDVWNAVMREGDRGKPDEFGFCCPTCFMQLADERGVGNHMWVVAPDPVLGPYRTAEALDAALTSARATAPQSSPEVASDPAVGASERLVAIRERADGWQEQKDRGEWITHGYDADVPWLLAFIKDMAEAAHRKAESRAVAAEADADRLRRGLSELVAVWDGSPSMGDGTFDRALARARQVLAEEGREQ